MTMAAPPGIPPSVAKLPLEDLQKLTVECLKKLKVGAEERGGGELRASQLGVAYTTSQQERRFLP